MKGLVSKRTVRAWLIFLRNTPLYQGIEIDQLYLNGSVFEVGMPNNDTSEVITMEDSPVAQQQTLLWDEDKYLGLAPGEECAI